MEIELKYSIPNAETANEIWANELFSDVEEKDSREEMCFDARYYDTENWDLSAKEIAYRVRREGGELVATLKWKGHAEGALHVREEMNVTVSDDDPDLSVFDSSKVGCDLEAATEGKPLICLVQTKFNRRRFKMAAGGGIYELSLDEGWIITPYGEDRILEVELELFSGETEELEKMGTAICEKYGLQKEDRSKYARGLELINSGKNNKDKK